MRWAATVHDCPCVMSACLRAQRTGHGMVSAAHACSLEQGEALLHVCDTARAAQHNPDRILLQELSVRGMYGARASPLVGAAKQAANWRVHDNELSGGPQPRCEIGLSLTHACRQLNDVQVVEVAPP